MYFMISYCPLSCLYICKIFIKLNFLYSFLLAVRASSKFLDLVSVVWIDVTSEFVLGVSEYILISLRMVVREFVKITVIASQLSITIA